jgi:hypothetical protein
MNIDFSKLSIEIDGVDTRDYPDFCDAYISGGTYDGEELTEEMADYIMSHHSEWFYEQVFQSTI